MDNREKEKRRQLNQCLFAENKKVSANSHGFSLFSVFHSPSSRWHNERGQSMIEFTFAMMVTLLLIYALLMVFRWAGLDQAERRFSHEYLLQNASLRPEQQLAPEFYKSRKLDSAFRGFDLK